MGPLRPAVRPGQRMTRQRRAVMRALESFDRPFSAGELTRAVAAADPGVGRASVYRTLALMVSTGQVQRLHTGGRERYTLCLEPEHHHHVTCTLCGRTEDFSLARVEAFEAAVEAAVAQLGYLPQGHVLEVHGLCRACAERVPESDLASTEES
jgi:Fur family transcriptional regulator, ferric uptake regulator